MRQRNSFDSLRLLGSVMVMVGHAYIITGAVAPNIGTIPLHSFGVCIFFAISGFLISQSWMSDSDWRRYIIRRLLRIVPALVVVTAVTALLIGAFATTEPLTQYYRHGWTWRYIVSNSALITVWGLPGVFDNLPIHGQANGSLWTLPIEFSLYLITPMLALIGRQHRILGPAFVVMLAFIVLELHRKVPGLSTLNVLGVDVGKGFALVPYFWIGAAARFLDLSAWSSRTQQMIAALSLGLTSIWALSASPSVLPLGMIAITMLVLTVGLQDWLFSETLTRIGDLSYGTYLWAFPLQQFLFHKFGGGPALNVAITAPLVIGIAYCSWHVIERQALRLKPKQRLRPSEEHEPASSDAAVQSPA